MGKLGTHCMRKTFANKVYEKLDGRLEKVQQALEHRNINSTAQYLSFREEDIDKAILAA
jgi:integrase